MTFSFTSFTLFCTLLFSTITLAQDNDPIFLKAPADWRYEKIDLPPEFAPEISLKGFEELRFSPGMFDRESTSYFSYVFAAQLNEKATLKKTELVDFLETYYRGLCTAVAESKNIKISDLHIGVVSFKKTRKRSKKAKFYAVDMIYFDTFNDGQKLTLHMELKVVKDKGNRMVNLLALVSPQTKQSDIWKKLFEIEKQTKLN